MAKLNHLCLGNANTLEALQFRSAVEKFQCDHKIKVTGICDAATQAKLEQVHGY